MMNIFNLFINCHANYAKGQWVPNQNVQNIVMAFSNDFYVVYFLSFGNYRPPQIDGELITMNKLHTFGGVKSSCSLIWLCSISSRDSKRNSWDAARISTGNKCGLIVTDSRNLQVCARKVASCSKSWKCFDTQCLWGGKTETKFSWTPVLLVTFSLNEKVCE